LSNIPRYTNRRSLLTRCLHVHVSRVDACMRAGVCACVRTPRGTAKPMAWTGMWVMSVFSSIAFRDGDRRSLDLSAGYSVKREPRSLILSRDFPRPAPATSTPRSRFSPLFSRGWTRGPAILLQLPDQRRDPVTLRSLRRRAV